MHWTPAARSMPALASIFVRVLSADGGRKNAALGVNCAGVAALCRPPVSVAVPFLSRFPSCRRCSLLCSLRLCCRQQIRVARCSRRLCVPLVCVSSVASCVAGPSAAVASRIRHSPLVPPSPRQPPPSGGEPAHTHAGRPEVCGERGLADTTHTTGRRGGERDPLRGPRIASDSAPADTAKRRRRAVDHRMHAPHTEHRQTEAHMRSAKQHDSEANAMTQRGTTNPPQTLTPLCGASTHLAARSATGEGERGDGKSGREGRRRETLGLTRVARSMTLTTETSAPPRHALPTAVHRCKTGCSQEATDETTTTGRRGTAAAAATAAVFAAASRPASAPAAPATFTLRSSSAPRSCIRPRLWRSRLRSRFFRRCRFIPRLRRCSFPLARFTPRP